MSYRPTVSAFILFAASLTGCSTADESGTTLHLSNPTDHDLTLAPVVVSWEKLVDPAHGTDSYVVLRAADGTEIPSQVDDVNGDGRPDELFTLVDLAAGSEVELSADLVTSPPTYPARTQAFLAVRQDGGFDDDGVYRNGSDFVEVRQVEVPAEQEQDSDWARFEGPVWESDLIGYRYYLDDRFRTDVFGKRVPEPVLHRVEGDYHAISDWGADVLKVGPSLGLGSPAVMTDAGPAVIDNADRRAVEIVASGPLRSIIRTSQYGWSVMDSSVDVVTELEIHAGHRWTEQRIQATGLPESARMATGIVRHPEAEELFTSRVEGVLYAYTWGVQSDQNHFLGMAVLVPATQDPTVDDSDPNSHLVTFSLERGAGVYRYLAAWEQEPHPVMSREEFESVVRDAAQSWTAERTLVPK